MFGLELLLLFTCLSSVHSHNDTVKRKFPDNFKFGASTSSYQIEGAWNVDGKSENIWDHITHTRPGYVKENANGDVACDSYNLYKKDVQIIKELGLDFYRFSISWSRILPRGFSNEINLVGVNYYDNLINELLANDIVPMVTLYHLDLPQILQELGGWTNPLMVNYFEDYARVVFENFGDRVKDWITINEPDAICLGGYGRETVAPALNMSGTADYLCGHTVLLSHARVYHMYDKEFRRHQKGRISLTLSAGWLEPADDSPENVWTAQQAVDFHVGWFANPIFSKSGDYPRVMREKIDRRSLEQGYTRSRLPTFTKKEVEYIKGTYDFFGLNHYTSRMVRALTKSLGYAQPSYDDDRNVDIYHDENWAGSSSNWLYVVPWGLRKLLNWIKNNYDNPEIMIFENGFSDTPGTFKDTGRIEYHKAYLNSVLDAIEDGCSVTAYALWSLMDNFEWTNGYTIRFGLYHVDFNSSERTRTPKASAKYYSGIIKNRLIEPYI